MDYRRVMRRYAVYGPTPYYCEMPGVPGECHLGTLAVAYGWYAYCCRHYLGPVRLCRADGTVLRERC